MSTHGGVGMIPILVGEEAFVRGWEMGWRYGGGGVCACDQDPMHGGVGRASMREPGGK